MASFAPLHILANCNLPLNRALCVSRMIDSELQLFAKWFHQDFVVVFDSLEEGAEIYLKQLSAIRYKKLISELQSFLLEHSGKNHRSKRNAWFKLGAQWFDNKTLPLYLEGLIRSKV